MRRKLLTREQKLDIIAKAHKRALRRRSLRLNLCSRCFKAPRSVTKSGNGNAMCSACMSAYWHEHYEKRRNVTFGKN